MFLKDILLFIVFQLFIIYPLGRLTLNFLGVKLWWVPNLVFGISIGIVVLTLSVLSLGYTNNYSLLPIFIIIPPILLLFQLKNISLRQISLRNFINKSDLVVISAIILCVLVQSIIVFPNGIRSEGFLRIKNVFTEDGMWHVAIINNLQKSIPPQNPIFAGEKLTNYNYFSDVYISIIQKFTGIETLTLYFKLIGPFLAFLAASSLYFLLKEFSKNKLIASLGVLLITLGSTYYYIFGIFKPSLNINPSTFFGNDYVSRMVNYQLSFSYLIITTFIFLLLTYKKINSIKFYLVTAFLISSSLGFKSYGTILIIVALYLVGFYLIFKKEFGYIKIALLSSLFTVMLTLLFLRNSKAVETVFAFNPFWLVENIFTDPLRLNSANWLIKRNFYLESNNYLGIAYLYLKGIVIFLFIQFGLKILGFLSIFKVKYLQNSEKHVVLLISTVVLLGILMPLTFTQGGVKWNTIQFIWYSSFGLGILLTLLISDLQKRIGLKLAVIIMIITWTSFLPGVFYYSRFYLSDNNNLTTYNFKGTQESYQAAKFLSSQPDGVLLLDSTYLQTPFIMAISGKNAYFADESILSNLLINWHDRNQEVEKFFSKLSTEDDKKRFLQRKNISYIFTEKNRFELTKYFMNIYNNSEISIYRFINPL